MSDLGPAAGAFGRLAAPVTLNCMHAVTPAPARSRPGLIAFGASAIVALAAGFGTHLLLEYRAYLANDRDLNARLALARLPAPGPPLEQRCPRWRASSPSVPAPR